MAKKITETKSGGFDFEKMSTIIKDISQKSAIIIEDNKEKRTFIDTGIYVLNALLSKSILKGGISKNRISVLCGPTGVGKSYICYNIARNAQKEGYNIIYIDTEFSIELSDFHIFGVDTDPSKFMLIRSNKVEELKIALTQLLNKLVEQKKKGIDIPKTILFLDSVGQLASAKEVEDAVEGKQKVDMSRAKALKSFFRIISSDLGYLKIPMVCTNHVYMTQDLFPVAVMSGGEGLNYTASTIVYLTIAKLKTGEEVGSKEYIGDLGSSGVIVSARARKNRLAKPMLVKFEIDHTKGTNPFKGLEYFCTAENYEKVGIVQGKVEVDAKTGEIKVSNSNRYYIKHLDKYVYEKQLFNSKVFTKEVLAALEPIIENYFTYSSYEEFQKEMETLDEQWAEFEKNDDIDIDELDDEKLFDK
jgi:RecA/RadA recombinase